MSKRSVLLAFVSLSLLLGMSAAALPAHADSQARIVRLSFVRGDVQVDRVGTGFERAFRNMPIVEGMRLWVGDDSRAEVEFEDGSAFRVVDNSMVALAELRLRDGVRLNHVAVEQGLVYFDVRRKDSEDFRVSFGNRQVHVPRQARFRVHVLPQSSRLAVTRGEVEMFGDPPGQMVRVRSGETISLDFEDPGRYYLAKDVESLAFDAWEKERVKFRERELAMARTTAADPYYMVTDLYHYGAYFHHPAHGRLWRPHHVGLHWDPFFRGAWVWYPRFGFVWVSYHPWGWAPFRFGSWVFVSNVGWCWNPVGFHFATWHRVPVFRHAPPAFRAPRPPRTPGVTVVVNVPRDRDRRGGGGDWRSRDRSAEDGRTRVAGSDRDGTRPRVRGDGGGGWRSGDGTQSVAGGSDDTLVAERDAGEFVARTRGSDHIPSPRPLPTVSNTTGSDPRTRGRTDLGTESGSPGRREGSPREDAASRGWQRGDVPMPRDNGVVTRSQPEARTDVAPAPATGVRPGRERPAPRTDVAPQRAVPSSRAQPQPRPQPQPEGHVTPAPQARPEPQRDVAPTRSAPAPQARSEPQREVAPTRFAPVPQARPEPQPDAAPARSAPVPQARFTPARPVPQPGRGPSLHERMPAAPEARSVERPAPVRSFAPAAAPARSGPAPAAAAPARSAPAPAAAPARSVSVPTPSRGVSAPARSRGDSAAAPARGSGGRVRGGGGGRARGE